jgi:hypothetical protein
MDYIGSGGDRVAQKLGRHGLCGIAEPFPIGESRATIDRDGALEAALLSPHLTDVEVTGADRIRFAPRVLLCLCLSLRQTREVVGLQAAMHAGVCQVRDNRRAGKPHVVQSE